MNINLQPNITGTNVKLVRGAIQSDLTNAVNSSRTYRDESEAFSIVSENKSIVATDSANSAYSSATTASNAANTAITKANEANSSAISASASETVCIDKTIIATDKADISTAQAVIATNKAIEANNDADTATTQAGIAITKASEASVSASNALVSANNADTSEANALTYRNDAEGFATSINPSNIVHISGTEIITGDKTFTGTVSGLTSSMVGLGNVTNESKATMFTSPTFSGTVTLPPTTSIGNVSSIELGYIDGVTSSIQTQLDSKVAKVTSTNNAIVRFDGTTGDVQNSSVIIDDNNIIYSPIPIRFYTSENSVNLLVGSNLENRALEFSEYVVNTVNGVGHRLNAPSAGGQITFATESVDRVLVTASGSLLLKSGTGALGYGAGAGGTVTQLTSKSNYVTLNKPSGRIIMHNASLASGASVVFGFGNSLINHTDLVYCHALTSTSVYSVDVYSVSTGSCSIVVKNESAASLAVAVPLAFCIIKGATE